MTNCKTDLSGKQVCNMLGITQPTVRKLVAEGKLSAHRSDRGTITSIPLRSVLDYQVSRGLIDQATADGIWAKFMAQETERVLKELGAA